MGAGQSGAHEIGGSTMGYQVLRVYPNSPGSRAGLKAYFDFIVAIGNTRFSRENGQLRELLKASVDQKLKMIVYNTRSKSCREVEILPSTNWGGNGLLGVSIKHSSFDRADERVWHVVDVENGSPALQAGFKAGEDYIIGSDSILQESDDLYNLIEAHEGKALKLFVYNINTDNCREVVCTPNSKWGGKGYIGCEFGHGLLHRIPTGNTCQIEDHSRASLLRNEYPSPVQTTPASVAPTGGETFAQLARHGDFASTQQNQPPLADPLGSALGRSQFHEHQQPPMYPSYQASYPAPSAAVAPAPAPAPGPPAERAPLVQYAPSTSSHGQVPSSATVQTHVAPTVGTFAQLASRSDFGAAPQHQESLGGPPSQPQFQDQQQQQQPPPPPPTSAAQHQHQAAVSAPLPSSGSSHSAYPPPPQAPPGSSPAGVAAGNGDQPATNKQQQQQHHHHHHLGFGPAPITSTMSPTVSSPPTTMAAVQPVASNPQDSYLSSLSMLPPAAELPQSLGAAAFQHHFHQNNHDDHDHHHHHHQQQQQQQQFQPQQSPPPTMHQFPATIGGFGATPIDPRAPNPSSMGSPTGGQTLQQQQQQ